jgi:hypothetical protein
VTDTDLAIVGGGAAGLAAAIFAAQQAHSQSASPRILILDGAKSLGAKILVSGGGRCNVTHDHIAPADFNGPKNIVRNILAAFDIPATIAWFESMGVQLKREETGKLFPVTDSAKSVLAALLQRCAELNITILPDHRVEDIRPGPPFTIRHSHGTLTAAQVVMATGGRSLPKTGSDGQAWEIAQRLGHTVTDTHPALVPLVLHESFFHAALSGLSLKVELSTFAAGKLIDRRTGSLLWTHFGISGPVVMDASRHWVIAQSAGQSPQLVCRLLPGRTPEQIERMLIDASASARPVADILSRRLPSRLADALVHHAGLPPRYPMSQLSRPSRRALATLITQLPLPVLHDRGWNYAEVTAGGVRLSEIDYRTMQSRKTPGLYLVGEMLDCDGRIGGFNFQWAWATGHIAGRHAGVRDKNDGRVLP